MSDNKSEVINRINIFFKKAFEFYGKEVGLYSNQYFGINQIIDPKLAKHSKYKYKAQYGFTKSGAVIMDFTYDKEKNSIQITGVSVYAPPADKELIVVNYTPETQIDDLGLGIQINMGVDMGTEEHTTLTEIASNPNALKMFDMAIADLSKGQILGECCVMVPIENETIPCCDSRQITENKGVSK